MRSYAMQRPREMRPLSSMRGILDDAQGVLAAGQGAVSDAQAAANAAAAAAAGAVSAAGSLSISLGGGGGSGMSVQGQLAPAPGSTLFGNSLRKLTAGVSSNTLAARSDQQIKIANEIHQTVANTPSAASLLSNLTPAAVLALRWSRIDAGIFAIDAQPAADSVMTSHLEARGAAIVTSSATLMQRRATALQGPTGAASARGFTIAQAFRGAQVQTGFYAWYLAGMQQTEQPAVVQAFQAAYASLASSLTTVAAPAAAGSSRTMLIAGGAVGLAAIAAVAFKLHKR